MINHCLILTTLSMEATKSADDSALRIIVQAAQFFLHFFEQKSVEQSTVPLQQSTVPGLAKNSPGIKESRDYQVGSPKWLNILNNNKNVTDLDRRLTERPFPRARLDLGNLRSC